MSELSPCPFCGEQHIYLNPPTEHHSGSINCPACMVSMPRAISGEKGGDELIRSWNARAAGWQPIETAPKDGTKLLLWTTTVGDDKLTEYLSTVDGEPSSLSCVQIGQWDPGNDASDPMYSRPASWETSYIGNPTHWMPLPAPPEIKP